MMEQYFKYTFTLLYQKDVKDYIGLMNPEERLDLFYRLTGRLDRFKVGMARAGDKSTTKAAIAAEKVEDIDSTLYQKVTITLADDLNALVKAANGGAKINLSILICPIAKPAP